MTSLLDPALFPASELTALYHQRWRIETIYRELKHVLGIQNLRSLTPAGVAKEAYAQLLLYNLVRYAMTEAAAGTNRTPVEYSFSAAVEAVNSALLQLSQQRAAALEEVYRQMLLEIRQAPVRIRPDHSYPRRREGKRNKGHGKYILPARLENP